MNFYIMSKDAAVAKWRDNNLEIINENLLPLYLKNTSNLLECVSNQMKLRSSL